MLCQCLHTVIRLDKGKREHDERIRTKHAVRVQKRFGPSGL